MIFSLLATPMSPAGSSPPSPARIRDLQASARDGEARAQYSLGMLLLRGRGLPRDRETGERWLEEARLGGDPRASYRLGQLARKDGDRAEAARFFREARDKGIEAADAALATLGPEPAAPIELTLVGEPGPERPGQETLQPAARRGGMQLLVFGQERCGWCRRFEPVVRKVVGSTQGVELVEVDLATPDGRRQGDRYGVGGTPHSVLLGPDGKVRGELRGYVPEPRLRSFLENSRL